MPASSSPPDPDGSPLSEADWRALVRFLEQSLDQGFRLAIVEAAGHVDREAILETVTPTIGPGLALVDAAELEGPVENLWLALKKAIAAEPPRCLALWNLESACPDWTGQLNVQRDLFVRDVAVPWLLFIHPASRVPLLRAAPDFCDFAVLWLRDERPPRILENDEVYSLQEGVLTLPDSVSMDSLLWRAMTAINEVRFDEARDALAQFDLSMEHGVFDRILRQIIGARMERAQGHLAVAEALIRDAGNTLAQQLATADVKALRMLVDTELAMLFAHSGRLADATTLMRRNMLAEQAVGHEHPGYAMALHNLADVLVRQGLYTEAERLLRESLAIQTKVEVPDLRLYGATLNVLASLLGSQGKHAEAEKIFRESLQAKVTALSHEHPSLGVSLFGLSAALSAQGRLVEAEQAAREALAIFEKTVGRENPEYARSLDRLAQIVIKQGRASEGESLLRDSITVLDATLGQEHPDSILALRNLGVSLLSRGRSAEAEATLRETIRRIASGHGREHVEYGRSSYALARVLSAQGKYAEAESLLYVVKRLYEANLGPEHPQLGPILRDLAVVEAEQGRIVKAIRLLERALEICRKSVDEDAEEVQSMEGMLKQLQRRRIRRRS